MMIKLAFAVVLAAFTLPCLAEDDGGDLNPQPLPPIAEEDA